jgi:Cu(I)/Ag(I) efflux system membrane protein CusA/SilA
LLIRACKEVGRPIFFAILIMILSFLPVFALTGMEGKMFRPLAFTKTFALVSVAVLSITLLPALLPLVLRGRIRSEEESWLVRSVVVVYRPLLAWLMERHRAVMLSFAVILGVGWVLAGHLGREFMPPLDEGSILEMPISSTRISVTQVADDLAARDALLRSFPEVEQVVGKAGRAETPTDPSPLQMLETTIQLRPKEQWPERHLERVDIARAVALAVELCVERGIVSGGDAGERRALADASEGPAEQSLDRALREVAALRQREEASELGVALVREAFEETATFLRSERRLVREPTPEEGDALVLELAPRHGAQLANAPLAPDVVALVREVAERLATLGVAHGGADQLVESHVELASFLRGLTAFVAGEPPDLYERIRERIADSRARFLEENNRALRWELEDLAAAALPTAAIEAVAGAARERGTLVREAESADHCDARARMGLRPFLRPKTKADLVAEMDSSLQMPGWGNIWTQPIVNRIDMLATGVRTMIGVKVFGKDLGEIQRVSEDVARVLRGIRGAVDVYPDQIAGEGYVEVRIDRERAARYGIDVADVQHVVEIASGGNPITQAVVGRERYPVRVRYSRDSRVDEDSLRRMLIAAPGLPSGDTGLPGTRSGAMPAGSASSPGMSSGGDTGAPSTRLSVSTPTETEDSFTPPLQIPLAEVADVRVVEGPSMIKSENGMLTSYVQLNVRDRDVVGFVEEARRAVEDQVELPVGAHLEWSGQFEHQVHARRTLQVVFPAVLLLIFAVLYVTYRDFAHAVLMMLAVPGALAGGVIFQSLFGFDFSVAVWVGYIACFGMASETGIVMLVYLREALRRHGGVAGIASIEELRVTVLDGAVRRLRPKLLTELTMILGLAPMLWASGAGAEVVRPMAAPVLGGILLADEVIDVLLPVLFYWWEKQRWRRVHSAERLLTRDEAALAPTPA